MPEDPLSNCSTVSAVSDSCLEYGGVLGYCSSRTTTSTTSVTTTSTTNVATTIRNLNDIPIAIAGIIGGSNSSVTDKTKRIWLEAAVFPPTIVRNSSREIGLRTDASSRYEKMQGE